MLTRSETGAATYLATIHHHVRDDRVAFDEPTHTYTVDGRRVGISVTGLIHEVTAEAFDAAKVATALAALPSKNYNAGVDAAGKFVPMTAEAILARWDRQRDLGTDLHAKIELFLNGVPAADLFAGDADNNAAEFRQFQRWFSVCGLEPYRTEWVIFDESADIAGSIDFVGRNPATGHFVIVDWKRCKHGSAVSNFASNYTGTHMMPPAQYLQECKLAHWAIQVNVYRCILEAKYGIVVERMLMLALYPDQDAAVEYEHARDDDAPQKLLEARRRPALPAPPAPPALPALPALPAPPCFVPGPALSLSTMFSGGSGLTLKRPRE